MNSKLISTLMIMFMMSVPYTSLATDSETTPKVSFTFGGIYLYNEGFDGLEGSGRTVDDEDDVTYFSVGYNFSPSLALEGGIMTESEITSSMSQGHTGTLHGKSYSISQGCASCTIGEGSGTLNLKAEIKDSYLFGVKFSPATKGALGIYAKAGMLYWDVAYTASNAQFTYNGTALSGRFLEVDGSDGYLGLGMSYAISKNSSFAIDYLSSEIHDSDISGYSLSFQQSF
jgi:hypothetical protein